MVRGRCGRKGHLRRRRELELELGDYFVFEHYYSLWKRDLLVDGRTNDRFLFDYIYIVSLIIILKQSFCILKILKISLKSYHVFFCPFFED